MSSKIRCIGVRIMKKIIFNNNKNAISEVLRLHRVQNKMTQQQLAVKMQVLGANMDQQMISKIESNDRIVTDYELVCFCHILKIEPNEMVEKFRQENGLL